MSEAITIADIYKLFEQTNAALERSRAEFDRRAAEADRRAAEADRRAAEAKAENDRRAAEAALSLAKLEKTVERTSKAVDGLTTRWGRFVEELVRSAVVRMFRDRGILITRTMERVRSPLTSGTPMEIDILGINGMKMVAVECKSRLSKDDVDEMGDRLTNFKKAFPEYAQYTLYGAVAGIEINEGVDIYAYRKGLFVIRTNGDSVEIANDDKFQPLAWG
ncbi:DUF3782 domain-containing protein [Pseudanabaena sp. FACHB-1277]|uniref:DUF3782 domain-containing protein n=1 Tax=Pseudanabaena cinerea FACHB-1277 TaxID=2949581 RepID=A0A926UUV3_9CYAN|nr:DUF3782 domain-containing protein [Pseudanabaena cinerea]MBD2151153.1 DUF3782 domain-containing protein [Pseudanabaena cinerea FACHB-1277]